MSKIGQLDSKYDNRMKRLLMIWCALILFALGVWLLVEPAKARGAESRPSDHDQPLGTPRRAAHASANRVGYDKCHGRPQVTIGSSMGNEDQR